MKANGEGQVVSLAADRGFGRSRPLSVDPRTLLGFGGKQTRKKRASHVSVTTLLVEKQTV